MSTTPSFKKQPHAAPVIEHYHQRVFQKTVELPARGMNEMGRSRMVLPGVGSPKTHNKSSGTKVDPSCLVVVHIL
jgi:hypothetical protein